MKTPPQPKKKKKKEKKQKKKKHKKKSQRKKEKKKKRNKKQRKEVDLWVDANIMASIKPNKKKTMAFANTTVKKIMI